jgi:hypothetical protein
MQMRQPSEVNDSVDTFKSIVPIGCRFYGSDHREVLASMLLSAANCTACFPTSALER